MIWHEVLSWIRSTAGPPVEEDDFIEWWLLAIHSTPCALRKGAASLVLLKVWWFLKHRNTVVSNNTPPNTRGCGLLDTIRSVAQSWADAGAVGLRAMIDDVA
jgi:hypothetical protein